jgi:hypothetical protein
MLPINPRVTCLPSARGLYQLYYESRWVDEAVTVYIDPLYVSQSFIEGGGRVRSLFGAAHWLEAIVAPSALLSPPADHHRIERH